MAVTVDEGGGGAAEAATGGGWIPDGGGGKANFSFNARDDGAGARGRIGYDANGHGLKLKGTVAALSVDGGQITLSGPCQTGDGSLCRYEASAEDGDPDRFGIRVYDMLGSLVHEASAPLGGGSIQAH